jgi:hypothetical protein
MAYLKLGIGLVIALIVVMNLVMNTNTTGWNATVVVLLGLVGVVIAAAGIMEILGQSKIF